MKKTILTLSTALLCAQGIAFAQNPNNTALPADPVRRAASHPATAGKTTAASSRMVGVCSRVFNNGNLQLLDSMHLHYGNASYGYDAKANQWKYDMGTSWSHDGTAYEETYHSMQAFDANSRIISNVGEAFDGSTWVDNDYTGRTYDAAGNIATETSAYFNGSAWDSSRSANTYDAGGRVTLMVRQNWNKVTSQWQNSYQMTNTYNSNGQQTKTVLETWDNNTSQWQNNARTIYTYVNNQRTEALDEVYFSQNWVNGSKTLYTYNAQGNVETEESMFWNVTAWEPSQKMTYTYNSSNEVLTSISATWQVSAYVNQNRLTASYNSYHQALIETNERWNDLAMKFELQDGNDETRYYYEEYTNSVKDVATAAGSISVYPVPAKNTLNLRTSFTNAEAGNVILTDMGGRIVKQLQLPTSKQYNTSIDVSALAPGNYTISVNAGGKLMTQKVVVQ